MEVDSLSVTNTVWHMYVYSENALDTKVQQREDTSVLDHDHCTVYEIKPLFASTN
jgi:hypothetical protein